MNEHISSPTSSHTSVRLSEQTKGASILIQHGVLPGIAILYSVLSAVYTWWSCASYVRVRPPQGLFTEPPQPPPPLGFFEAPETVCPLMAILKSVALAVLLYGILRFLVVQFAPSWARALRLEAIQGKPVYWMVAGIALYLVYFAILMFLVSPVFIFNGPASLFL